MYLMKCISEKLSEICVKTYISEKLSEIYVKTYISKTNFQTFM